MLIIIRVPRFEKDKFKEATQVSNDYHYSKDNLDVLF